jgi:hypothetical protein
MVEGASGSMSTITSPSFSPPANSRILALFANGYDGTLPTSATDSLSAHLSYAEVNSVGSGATGASGAYLASVGASAPGAMTVTVNFATPVTDGSAVYLAVVVLDNASGAGAKNTTLWATSTNPSLSLTPQAAGSLVLGIVENGYTSSPPTIPSGQSNVMNGHTMALDGAATGTSAWAQYATADTTAGAPVTISDSSGVPGGSESIVEITPAVSPTPTPTAVTTPTSPPTSTPTPTPTPSSTPTPTGGVPNATADFTRTVADLPLGAISTTVSTYGSAITTDTLARNVYSGITNGEIIRIPLQWNNGNPISSAGGGPTNISGDAWVSAIKSIGAKLMIVIGGTNDNNFSPSDAANLVARYNPYAVVIGNEAGNSGTSIQSYTANEFLPAAKAIRAVNPNTLIAGPGWAWFDTSSLRYFVSQVKGYLDILDWHDYGCGNPPAPSDSALMTQSHEYQPDVAQARSWLNAAGMTNTQIEIGEYNLAWQFDDGATSLQGGDGRFYTDFNTAWSASVIGHALESGGRTLAYSEQNGPLGIMVEPGKFDDGQPDSTPMPIYHAIGAFQGEGLHRDFGNAIMASSSTNPLIDIFAGSSGNVVAVNEGTGTADVELQITGATDGTKTLWATNTGNPFAPPSSTTIQVVNGRASFNLQGYQVATLIT